MKTQIYAAPAVKGLNWDDEERDHGNWLLLIIEPYVPWAPISQSL